jgi:hypothetical protein
MTQSNNSTVTITLDDTYGTTTSYIDTIDDITLTSDSTFTLDDEFSITDITTDNNVVFNDDNNVVFNTNPAGTFTIDTAVNNSNDIIYDWEVERMCNEYPALTKVWRNFKSVYDMVKQDYKGKKEAGEINDSIPF